MANEFDPASYKRKLEETYLLESVKKSFDRPKSKWEHPLTLLIFSFGLTGIIGSAISIGFQWMQSRDQRTAHEYEDTTKALAAFSDSLYKRYIWATMLYSSMTRGASSEEVQRRKKEYDDALVAQESTLLSSELLMRQGLKSVEYNEFESKYEYSVRLRLKTLDYAITQMTHDYLKDTSATTQPVPFETQSGCVKALFSDVVNCNSAICNSVFLAVSSKAFVPQRGEPSVSTLHEAWQNFGAQCPTPRDYRSYTVPGCEYVPPPR